MSEERYFGKYRGTVFNNVDPLQQGRLQVEVPSVLGTNTMNWALPSVPYAGNQVGMFFIPPVGANVWVEFEAGDSNSPIWTGCFWGTGEVPVSPAVAQMKVIKTDSITITLDDLQTNTFKIETVAGMQISVSPTGIVIDNGQGSKIQMQGPQVSVNNNSFAVTS